LTQVERRAYSLGMFPDGIWNNPMWKTAARAGLRRISQMVSQGNIAGANRLATTPGVLKPTQQGSQIRHLGAGSEGVSSLVAHADRGVEVRKVIDPKGMAGPGMVANREAFGRAMQGNPDVAEFRGAYNTPHGLRAQHFEYAPGQRGDALGIQTPLEKELAEKKRLKNSQGTPGADSISTAVGSPTSGRSAPASVPRGPDPRAAAMAQQLGGVSEQGRAMRTPEAPHGFHVADLHGGNVMMNPDTGKGKVVDFLPIPMTAQGTIGNAGVNKQNFQQMMDADDAAQKGVLHPYKAYLDDPRRSGNVMARAFRGAPPLTPGSSMELAKKMNVPGANGPVGAPAPVVSKPMTPAVNPSTISTNVGKISRPRPTQ
jgi:hypothetical protein